MSARFLVTTIFSLLLPLLSPGTTALTMKEFSDICDSSPGECSNHPILQAYVGGALDLLASLDEKTGYLNKMYCKPPKELFDVPNIIRFMEQRRDQYAAENAMQVLVLYIEKHGGCPS